MRGELMFASWQSEGAGVDVNNFQRVGASSNTAAGIEFEAAAQNFFRLQGLSLSKSFPVLLGATEGIQKVRKFDLGSEDPAVLVECKSHNWTIGGNSPSAKMTVWTESMYYFFLAPQRYRKIFFILRSMRRETSLAAHYLKNYPHLVPGDVEFWEYESECSQAIRLR